MRTGGVGAEGQVSRPECLRNPVRFQECVGAVPGLVAGPDDVAREPAPHETVQQNKPDPQVYFVLRFAVVVRAVADAVGEGQ